MAVMPASDPRFIDWREGFHKAPLAKKVVTSLEGRSQEIWRRTFDLLRKESPEYRNAVDDEFTAESKSHCGELLENIIAIAAGRLDSSDPFAFVRKRAEWRAQHQVPLVASGIPRCSLEEYRWRPSPDCATVIKFIRGILGDGPATHQPIRW